MDEQSKPTEKEESKVATTSNQFTIILDELAPEVTVDEIEELFKTNSVKYVSIAKLTDTDLAVYGIVNHLAPRGNRNVRNTSTNKQYVLVTFESKEDLVILAHCILFEKNLKLANRKLHMMLHNKKGDYNASTAICVNQLNPMCTEQEIIDELNIVLRDERNKSDQESKQPTKQRNFILSCIVFFDRVTSRSKQFAFVDFNTAEAAEICIKAWNNASMKKHPNRLSVTKYEAAHQKMTKAERDNSKAKSDFTNLYVDKLPYAFQETDVFNLFSKYGTVITVKLKKPQSNVKFQNINSLPCSAYVNFQEQSMAEAALNALNGTVVLPGTNSIRIDFYQRANKFLGGLNGLKREELIKNTHWRVLFIRGITSTVTREDLYTTCEKYGAVQTLSLKTKIVEGRVASRGIAIVQYASKEDASEALQKLPFETSLGNFIEIDFYQSKESRMQELEKQRNPIQQVLNPAIMSAFRALSANRSRSPHKGGAARGKKQRNNFTNNNNKPSSKNRSRSNNQVKSNSPKKHNQQSNKPTSAGVAGGNQGAGQKQYRQKQPSAGNKKKDGGSAASSNLLKKDTEPNKEAARAQATNTRGSRSRGRKGPDGQSHPTKPAKGQGIAKKNNASAPQPLPVSALPPQPQPVQGTAVPPPAVTPLVQIPAEEFAKCQTDADKKQFLGNYLYQFVVRFIESQKSPDTESLAGKVTGMILDGQTVDYILYLCCDKKSFYQIVQEAIDLINSSSSETK